jgi:beta-glucanase (GH16 family)
VPGGDTFDEWHEYTIDWKPEAITWSVDGEVKRTLERSSTWNETGNRYMYPQTPMRMQLSLWPAGQASNAAGTVAWAGGQIDWNSQDIQEKGYYYATFGEISVECYDPPKSSYSLGSKSYIFVDEDGLESSVRVTDNSTVLASLGATGLDMNLGGSDSSGNSSSSSDNSTSNSIPQTHIGSGNAAGNSGSTGNSSSSGSSGSSGFSQGNSDSGSNDSNGASSPNERVLRGSFFAVLVAVVVLVAL